MTDVAEPGAWVKGHRVGFCVSCGTGIQIEVYGDARYALCEPCGTIANDIRHRNRRDPFSHVSASVILAERTNATCDRLIELRARVGD